MAGTSEPNDLKFIHTFEKDLERNAASGVGTCTDSMRSSPTTTTTTTATTIDGNRKTPSMTDSQANEDPATDTRHGHEICPNPLPWSPYQHFQGPMCGCRDSDWIHGGTTVHGQNETNAS